MSAPAAAQVVNETMTDAEMGMLDDALSHAHVYLEYGAGNSTRRASGFSNITSITSVESDAAFISEHVQTDHGVQAAQNAGILRFIVVDLGPTTMWGFPVDDSRKYMWSSYAMSPYVRGYVPDAILIDGRFRVACALLAALQAPEAIVLIHDYVKRSNYFVLERFFRVDAVADSMVRLSLKRGVNRQKVARLLKKYINSPGDASPCTEWLRKKFAFLKTYKTCQSL